MSGTIYKRPKRDGSLSWYAVSDIGPGPDGRRRQKTSTHRSKREAEDALRARVTAVRDGSFSETNVTVAAYLTQWLQSKVSLRPTTQHSYEMYIRVRLIPALGHVKLRELRSSHIDSMYHKFRNPLDGPTSMPLQAPSLRKIHAILLSALNAAVKKRLIPYNPASAVEIESAPRPTTQIWSVNEISLFLSAVSGERLMPMFHLVITRGLRRGEAVGLRWEDVDLDRGLIRVEQQAVQVGYQVQTGPPKTRSGVRSVTLDSDTLAVMRRHHAAQARERLACGELWSDTGLVFTTETGSMLHPEFVTKTFQRLSRKHGLRQIRFHDLRHTAASMALAAGVPMKVVSVQLGHSSTSITADIYSHISPELEADAAERVASLLRRNTGI